MTKIAYLATPYPHDDPKVRGKRFLEACQAVAGIANQGQPVYSPIAHTHTATTLYGLAVGFEDRKAFNESMIDRCDSLLVLITEGWSGSKGVAAEIEYARKQGKPVGVVFPEGDSSFKVSYDESLVNSALYLDYTG